MSHFFAYLAKMKYIERWGLMRNTEKENIQEHSLQVAIIAHALALIRNELMGGNVNADRVAALALYHEIGEVIVGDLPTPVKNFNPTIRQAFSEIEEEAKKKLLHMLPEELKGLYEPLIFPGEEDQEAVQLVKAADRICAYLKCLQELKHGNEEFSRATLAVKKRVDEISLPEVKYFLDTFLDSFMLTIDELNS